MSNIKTYACLWRNAAWFVFEPFRDHGVDVVGAQPPVDILRDAEQEVGGGLGFVVLALDVEARNGVGLMSFCEGERVDVPFVVFVWFDWW